MTTEKVTPNTKYVSRITHYASRHKYLTSLLLFLLALIPRLPELGRFLTADEFLWVDRSRNFLAGLTNPLYQCPTVVEKWEYAEGLTCTLRTGHPGVTTMWSGSFGFVLRWLLDGRPTNLHDYVVAVSTNPLDPTFIAPERLGTVLITSLAVVAIYWLARLLFGTPVALVGAILIALNPFYIAYSRVIHHDALSTTFMILSVLCALIYWGERRGRKWLLLSGLLAGLAFISKLAALFLMPFIALIGFWFLIANWWNGRIHTEEQERPAFAASFVLLVLEGLLWVGAAIGVVFILWPAMWVAPVETLQTAFLLGLNYSTGPHAKGVFFLGESMADPGPLFYPITWLYHTSPLVMFGLIGLVLAWLGQGWRNKTIIGENPHPYSPLQTTSWRYLPLIFLFILGYYILMSAGEKKQERYFLPVYPWLDFVAAFGLVAIVTYLLSSFAPRLSQTMRSGIGLLVAIIFLVNGYFLATNFPYYFTYYNPLLGGINSAAKVITIGWGEGLDLAAAYLNQQTEPDQTRVASWYESTFAPFYHGPAISYSKEKGKVLAGDYAVFYINQTQRRFPDDVLFDYFESRFEPIETITLHGLNYAWIYPSLGIDHYLQDQTYTGIASLLAWQWSAGDQPLQPGLPADFELYWEYLGKQLDEPFFFRLVDSLGRAWAEGESRPVAAENPPVQTWREGEIIYERGSLTPPPGMPPGQYLLQIGFYTQAPAVTEGELLFILPEGEDLVTIRSPNQAQRFDLPATATPVKQPLGDSLTLLGGSWPVGSIPPETTFPLELYWRVEQPLPAKAALHLGLMDGAGEARQAWFNLTLAETFNPAETIWQPGDVIHTRWQLELLPEVVPGEYYFELVSPDDVTITRPFGRLVVSGE